MRLLCLRWCLRSRMPASFLCAEHRGEKAVVRYIMRAQRWKIPTMFFSSFIFPFTARSKATIQWESQFFHSCRRTAQLTQWKDAFPSKPYYRNMLHNTLYILLVASLLRYQNKPTCIQKRTFAQTHFLCHPPLICPLSYYIIRENWFHGNIKFHAPKDLKKLFFK